MGWGSGSGLMSEIITSLKPSGLNDGAKIQVYEKLIEAFEGHDCDTLMECLGQDQSFDRAYRNLNPSDDGLYSAKEGKKLSDNPHKEGTDAFRDWAYGWNEYHNR